MALDSPEQAKYQPQARLFARLIEAVDDAVISVDEHFVATSWNKGAERMYGWTAEEVLGGDVRDFIRSRTSDGEREEVRRRTAEDGGSRAVATVHRKDGTSFEVESINVAVRDEHGELTGYFAIHRDVTDRRRAVEEREQWARQQTAVADLGLRALASDDLHSLMDEAVQLVARTLVVDLVSIVELLPGEGRLLLRAGVGWKKGLVGNATTNAGRDSLIGHTILVGEPVVSEDLAADSRFEISPLLAGQAPASGMSVMIAGLDGPFGGLGAFSREPRSFTEHEVNFMQAVANVLATAVERADTADRIREARDSERRRIARGLHDEALQDLTHALSQAGSLPSGAKNAEAAGRLRELVPTLKRIGQQLRGAIYNLRLVGEEHKPFPELLEGLVEVHRAMAADYDIQLDLREGVPARSLGSTGSEALRIVSEALTNARRHSGAGIVRVVAWGSPTRLGVEISDNGRGFDPDSQASLDGTGIKGMRERADLLRGDLRISSEAGAGTDVSFVLVLTTVDAGQTELARVLLVEDHAAVREAIALAFDQEPDFEVAGQAASLAEARTMLGDVDVALIDLGLPDGYGDDLIGELRAASPRSQALVLSATLDHAEIARAVHSGAAGALSKSAGLGEVVDSVRRLRAGDTLLPVNEVVELLQFASLMREQEEDDRRAIVLLTRREKEVLQALAEGLDSQQIADRLYITLRTERNHMSNILAKLGVHSQLQALVFALRYDVVELR